MSNPPLESRSGLPDELAYLRPLYERSGWRTHTNFGQLSAFWLHVHDSLREEGTFLQRLTADFHEGRIDAVSYPRVLGSNLQHYLQHLNGHHQIEDHVYFPKFRSLDPRMAAGFDLLEKDHDHIQHELHACAERANQFLAAFSSGGDKLQCAAQSYAEVADRLLALMLRHLADEEDLILPAMLHHGERQVS
jgi:iron-sulfur cluster repair protein YtfE (RIC family)